MKLYKYIITILAVLLSIAIISVICLAHNNNDLKDTIDIKNNRIHELQQMVYDRNYSLFICEMDKDENYELFMSCVYPDGFPEE